MAKKHKFKQHIVEVIREAGINPLTGRPVGEAKQVMYMLCRDVNHAYQRANHECTILFMGQTRRTIINGQEYRNPNF